MSNNGNTAASLNDILRLLTTSCKFPLASSLPVASALVKNGLTTKELVGAKSQEELHEICPSLNQQQLNKLRAVCSSSPRKRAAKSSTGSPAVTKRGRKYTVKDRDAPIDDTELELPIVLDEEIILKTVANVNRAPLMMLFAASVLKHQYPTYGAGSHLSLASAAAASAARKKAKSIGILRGTAVATSDEDGREVPEGYRILRAFGTIDVAIIRRGDKDGYWGLDIDAMERQVEVGNADPEVKWIHPAQVRAYLVRAFGEKDLAIVNGAIELLIRSWEEREPDSWSQRAWGWYVGVRPEIAYGREGWGQRGTVSCKDILNFRVNPVGVN
ncbi:uncharacterized protein V1513DRAFT_22431 [Lipomyces chichibuensis]|uniref:uncharacterized protein n=1 Tax=Lipomyces chichibuensis TaxID=1546026 RepID=UPI003343A61C